MRGELEDRHTQQMIHDGRVVPPSPLPPPPSLPSILHSVNVYQVPHIELAPGHAKTRKLDKQHGRPGRAPVREV